MTSCDLAMTSCDLAMTSCDPSMTSSLLETVAVAREDVQDSPYNNNNNNNVTFVY